MTHTETSKPAHGLAQHDCRRPNDSDDYRKARLALLAEEIELRRHIKRDAFGGGHLCLDFIRKSESNGS